MKIALYMMVLSSAFAMNRVGVPQRHHSANDLPAAYRAETPVEASAPVSDKATRLPLDGIFFPSGYQGDIGAIKFSQQDKTCYKENQPYMRFEYRPASGKLGWAAVSFQSNTSWGEKKGRDLSAEHFHRIHFAARGLRGGEKLIFTSGGGTPEDAKYPASYAERSLGTVALTTDWKDFSIEIGDDAAAWRNVLTALTWSTNQELNPDGAVFYIADAAFE